jgi:hypothetical protein
LQVLGSCGDFADPTFISVHAPAFFDLGEGCAEVVGDGVGGGDDVAAA